MQTINFQKTAELRRTKAQLEKQLNIKLIIKGKQAMFNSQSPTDEYEANLVLEAMSFGFSADKALLLKDADYTFRDIHIKDFTKRKNLHDVKARIIGTKGQTLQTLEQLSGCFFELKENEVAIIGPAEKIEEATTALTNLIKGSKQANVYRFLESSNSLDKTKLSEDLGLKK